MVSFTLWQVYSCDLFDCCVTNRSQTNFGILVTERRIPCVRRLVRHLVLWFTERVQFQGWLLIRVLTQARSKSAFRPFERGRMMPGCVFEA